MNITIENGREYAKNGRKINSTPSEFGKWGGRFKGKISLSQFSAKLQVLWKKVKWPKL